MTKTKYIQDSNSVIKYLTTDNKKWFNMTPFEVILFASGMLAMTLIPFLLKAIPYGYDWTNPFGHFSGEKYNWWDVIFTIAPVFGITGAVMLTTKSKNSWIFLVIEAVMYGMYTFYAAKSRALGSINMFIIPLIYSFSHFVTWSKHTKEGSEVIETRKLSLRQGIEITVATFLVAGLFDVGFIFGAKNPDPTNWLAWIDGLMGSVMLFATLAGAFRYRETWYIFFASNVIKILTWTIALSLHPDPTVIAAYATSLTLAIVYFINSVFGLIIWQKGKEEDIKEIKNL